MKLKKSTIEKLRQIQMCILREPELYDQGTPPISASIYGASCLAIWVDIPDLKKANGEAHQNGNGIYSLMDHLDINKDQAILLYTRWPDEFNHAWKYPHTIEGAIAGAARMDLFIKSNGTK